MALLGVLNLTVNWKATASLFISEKTLNRYISMIYLNVPK